jgi:hypothetical protein
MESLHFGSGRKAGHIPSLPWLLRGRVAFYLIREPTQSHLNNFVLFRRSPLPQILAAGFHSNTLGIRYEIFNPPSLALLIYL